jgi:hypothetical protein
MAQMNRVMFETRDKDLRQDWAKKKETEGPK